MAKASHAGSHVFPPPSAQRMGKAFVMKYYRTLVESPDLVQGFYVSMDGSRVSNVDLTAINKRIVEMDVAAVELATVESQESYHGGLLVLVTGRLTRRRDGSRHGFSHSFFLSPQGLLRYIVLNDMLHYTGEATAAVEHAAPEVDAVVQLDGKNAPASDLPESEEVSEGTPAAEEVNVQGDEAMFSSDGGGEEENEEAIGLNRFHSALGRLQKLLATNLPVTDVEKEQRFFPTTDEVDEHGYVLIDDQWVNIPLHDDEEAPN